MSNLDEAIRERAYHLWIADGRPEGKADLYWLSAQRELLTISVEAGSHAAAPTDAVATQPAKKARTARSRKARTA
jgi:hypothetical protein